MDNFAYKFLKHIHIELPANGYKGGKKHQFLGAPDQNMMKLTSNRGPDEMRASKPNGRFHKWQPPKHWCLPYIQNEFFRGCLVGTSEWSFTSQGQSSFCSPNVL